MSLILLFSLLTSVLSSVLGGVLPNIEQTKSAEHPDDASMAPKEIPLKVYQPVVFDQLCKEESNYCIYVDQVRPGIVQATPVSATDAHGAFLFERSLYADNPFRVCFGGCCIILDFAREPGCVQMSYVPRDSPEPGHLLARFADNVQDILGPRDDMLRSLMACAKEQGQTLPYAVIGARRGRKKKQQADGGRARSAEYPETNQDQIQQSQNEQRGTPYESSTGTTGDNFELAAQPAERDAPPTTSHDYFDDVTVPHLYA